MTRKAIVIGAGIGGIATAIRLSVKGFSVQVLEGNSYPGGKLSELTFDGYRFDAGPSLFTLPELVDELFLLAGKDPEKYFTYHKLDKICNYFYEDGTRLTAYADPDKFGKEVELKTGVSADMIKTHLAKSKEMYELTDKLFLQSSLHKLRSYLNKHAAKALLHISKLKTSEIMHDVNRKLFNNSKITQLFDRYATYNGSNPYEAPATLNIIPHLEYNLGAFFPSNGMFSITTSLVKLAGECGVKFEFNSVAEEIIVENKTAVGVRVNGEKRPADIIISNADVFTTYRKLLKTEKAPEKILKQEKSSSALVFYWGISRIFTELGLHNIFFSSDYKEEFNSIFKNKIPYYDPTVYINVSSKYQKEDAPAGHENWFVMINVPPNSGQDWDTLIAECRKHIINKINRILKSDISEFIQAERILDPRLIEQKTGSVTGALYGNSSNNQFSAFLRHPNFSSDIKKLYFCGGSVHPGGGIPLCLFSAKIIADLIK